ncbi:MAG: transketolase [Paraglaciecola sp.]|nr:transketolase [Paraglaciecola sp.]
MRNNKINYQILSNTIRGLVIDAVENAGHGHPGAALGMADIATMLYRNHLKFDPDAPNWHDRDRVVLSNGHGAMLLYSLLYLIGVNGVELEDIKSFRKAGSITPGHPEVGHTPGVEATTGPLGQGLGMAVGLALAEQRLRDEFGEHICNHRTWVFVGDGCLMEGVGQEAASLAGHLKLGQLNVLYDMNSISIDGNTDLAFTDNTNKKFEAMGWHTIIADGHNFEDIDRALQEAKQELSKPSIVLFKTIIGYGAPTKANNAGIHGSPLGSEEARLAKSNLNLVEEPFSIPSEVLQDWRKTGAMSQTLRITWEKSLATMPQIDREDFVRRMEGNLPSNFDDVIETAKLNLPTELLSLATRKASQIALEVVGKNLPELIGGSADLTGSNLTQTAATDSTFNPGKSGRYIRYGVREFAMAATMNGMSLHGGIIPYGGTFLVFSDYMRNAIRLSALMQTKVLYIMTHDSIGLGEDGPTHQPVEHLASLRAIPGMKVFRPADLTETIEAYQIALKTTGPSLFALSRQNSPAVRLSHTPLNLVSKGGYLIRETQKPRDLTIIATGTEVAIAIEAAVKLEKLGVHVAVVSLPCWSLFDAQPNEYHQEVLGDKPRLAIEAASSFGWTRYVADENDVLSVNEFGASASAEQLYVKFGLTSENLVAKALTKLSEESKP